MMRLTFSSSGLGAGISATAFNRHDILTTIVEIDPAVYDAARLFFGLPNPGPGKVFLEDARTWVAQRRASLEERTTVLGEWQKDSLYDIVVHDCFSGGGVPQHIFTMEFWEDLKAVIHPDAVVVVVRRVIFPPVFLTFTTG
jgi:spermidine synthase